MERVTVVVIFVLGIVGTIALGLVKDEISAWIPTLAKWIIRSAAAKLATKRPEDAERYLEEWLAHAEECPGRLGQLWHAFSVWGKVDQLARAIQPEPTHLNLEFVIAGSVLLLAGDILELIFNPYGRATLLAFASLGLQIVCNSFVICVAGKMRLSGRKYIEL